MRPALKSQKSPKRSTSTRRSLVQTIGMRKERNFSHLKMGERKSKPSHKRNRIDGQTGTKTIKKRESLFLPRLKAPFYNRGGEKKERLWKVGKGSEGSRKNEQNSPGALHIFPRELVATETLPPTH